MGKREKQTYVDLAYGFGSSKGNHKLAIDDVKVYVFVGSDVSIFSFGTKNTSFSITKETKIEDVIDFAYGIIGDKTVDIAESEIETLTVDRVENIYCTLLTEDSYSVVLSEDYFDFTPKDGDLVDGNLKLLADETKSRKSTINDKFQSLIKR